MHIIAVALEKLLRLMAICLIPYLYEYIISFMAKKPRWKSQTQCGLIIQHLTGERFISVRPPWLRNPLTGRAMEIDFYSQSLSLGIEYNGIQHYKYTPRFHKEGYSSYDGKVVSGMRHFELQVFRDTVKKHLCDEHGVVLLIVPYTISPYKLTSYILDKLLIIQRYRQKHKGR